MTDPISTDPVPDPGTDADHDRDSRPGIPGWLMAMGMAIVIVVLLMLAMMMVGIHRPPAGGH